MYKLSSLVGWRARWLAALIAACVQRLPAISGLVSAGETAAITPAAIVRAGFAVAGTLGAMHSLAGASTLVSSAPSPLTVVVGTPMNPVGFTISNTNSVGSWLVGGNFPPGLELFDPDSGAAVQGSGLLDAPVPIVADPTRPSYGTGTMHPVLRGTPTTLGTYTFTLIAYQFGRALGTVSSTFNYTVIVADSAPVVVPPVVPSAAPSFTSPPASQSVVAGNVLFFTAAAPDATSFQWQHNGLALDGEGSTTLVLNAVPASAGIYSVIAGNASGTTASEPIIAGLATLEKVIGSGSQVAADIHHPNGNIFDQVLLSGQAAAMTADPGQVLRASCLDGDGDIVQIEFSGAGTLSIVLDDYHPPAVAPKYNQPTVKYVQGIVGLVISGANETTNLSVFSVGRGTAIDQALFRNDVIYDGRADIAYVAILSSNGKFGGLRTANANYYGSHGLTGVYAPGVEFTGPVYIGNIAAIQDATPVIQLGTASDVRITGGDLFQSNGRAVKVSGFTQLRSVDGVTSHFIDATSTPGQLLRAKTIKARLEQDGVDVTARLVLNP